MPVDVATLGGPFVVALFFSKGPKRPAIEAVSAFVRGVGGVAEEAGVDPFAALEGASIAERARRRSTRLTRLGHRERAGARRDRENEEHEALHGDSSRKDFTAGA